MLFQGAKRSQVDAHLLDSQFCSRTSVGEKLRRGHCLKDIIVGVTVTIAFQFSRFRVDRLNSELGFCESGYTCADY